MIIWLWSLIGVWKQNINQFPSDLAYFVGPIDFWDDELNSWYFDRPSTITLRYCVSTNIIPGYLYGINNSWNCHICECPRLLEGCIGQKLGLGICAITNVCKDTQTCHTRIHMHEVYINVHALKYIYIYIYVAIVRIRVYTSDIVSRTGIVYCTRSRSQTVVRGRLATSCCRRGRLPPYMVASCDGRGEFVSWARILEESRRVSIMR